MNKPASFIRPLSVLLFGVSCGKFSIEILNVVQISHSHLHVSNVFKCRFLFYTALQSERVSIKVRLRH